MKHLTTNVVFFGGRYHLVRQPASRIVATNRNKRSPREPRSLGSAELRGAKNPLQRTVRRIESLVDRIARRLPFLRKVA